MQSISEVPVKNSNDDDEDEDEDIEAQIKKEIEGLRPKSSTSRLFEKVKSTIPCSKLVATGLI